MSQITFSGGGKLLYIDGIELIRSDALGQIGFSKELSIPTNQSYQVIDNYTIRYNGYDFKSKTALPITIFSATNNAIPDTNNQIINGIDNKYLLVGGVLLVVLLLK